MSSARPILSMHLTPDLVYYGGGPQMLRVLAKYTDPSLCRMILVSLSSADAFALPERPEVRIHGLRRSQAPLPVQLADFLAVLRTERPDVLHAYGAKCSLLAAIGGSLLGIPVVVWEIGLDIYNGRLLPRLADAVIEPLIKERICNSCATLKTRQGAMLIPRPLARWSVQCRGVPDREVYNEPFRSRARERLRDDLGLLPEDCAIVTIGGFIALRDHANTLRAAKHLVDAGHALKLVFIGDGPLRKETLALARELGLADRILFLGYVKNAAELLPAMDIYVNGAYAEGFGIATVEALLCRLAVVAVDAAANSEVVEHGHTGLLVPPKDDVALAQAIERLMREPALAKRLGEHGRRAALDLFAPKKLADAHMDICQRLTKRRGV